MHESAEAARKPERLNDVIQRCRVGDFFAIPEFGSRKPDRFFERVDRDFGQRRDVILFEAKKLRGGNAIGVMAHDPTVLTVVLPG